VEFELNSRFHTLLTSKQQDTDDITQLIHEINHLVLEEAAAEGPDTGEDEVELVPLLGTVWRRVLGRQQTLEQVAQHLQVTVVADRRDLLELGGQTPRNVFVEENGQVGAFRLDLARVNPATHIPADRTNERADLIISIISYCQALTQYYYYY